MPYWSKGANTFEELRRKAESLLQEQSVDSSQYPADIQELIQELKVHQTELEIQNEELKRTQEEVGNLHREYEDLYEFAPCGYLTLSSQGTINKCNLTGVKLLGVERGNLKSMSLSAFVTQASQKNYFSAFQQASQKGEQQTTELELFRQNTETVWVQANIQPCQNEEGGIEQWRITLSDITEQKQTEDALRESEMKFRNLSNSAVTPIMIYQYDYWIYVNPASEKITGYTFDELKQMKFWEVVAPEYIDSIKERGKARQKGEPATSGYEFKIITKQGKEKWVLLSGTTIELKNGKAGLISIIDITDRKQAEEELLKTKKRFDFALRATNTGLWDWNVQTGEIVFNEQWAAMVGYTLDELKPLSIQTWMDLCHPEDLEESNVLLENHFKGETEIYWCEARMKHKNGYWIWILDSGKVIEWDEYRRPLRMIGTHTDITERKQMEEKLYYLATKDILTDLWNHRYIIQAVQKEFERARRCDNHFFAVLMLDIDYFKEINDQHGHDAGDQVLAYVGDVIKSELRQVDIAGRYGGEEFVVILPQTDINGAYMTAEKLRISFYNTPLNYNYRNIYITVSIGAAEYHQSITSADEIIKIADNGLYEAKEKGKNVTVAIPRDRSQISSYN